jgi:hypothetical protein
VPKTPVKAAGGLTKEILYGIINAIVGAPTMISFAAIIFQVCSCDCMSRQHHHQRLHCPWASCQGSVMHGWAVS